VGDKGVVAIMSTNGDGMKQAVEEVEKITFTPQVGDEYDAIVETVADYGVFVKFKGKSGLVHVSEISHTRIEKVSDVLSVGDSIRVKYIGTDPKTGKMRLSRKATMPNPNPKPNKDSK
jgi:polyribonucleotide nucleotidyltransferase